MMRIQKYLIVFIVILSFVSCKGTDEESCSIIDFDEAQVMTEQELFSKVEIISLQNKDDLILSNVSQIIVEEPYILIKDSKNVFSKAYKIKFGKNGLQASDVDNLGKNEERLHNLLMSTEKEFPITTLETEKYISFLMKKGSNMKKWFMLFYDKSSGKIGRINCFSNKEIVFPIAKNADKTSLYAVVEKNRLQRIISHLKNNNVNISYKETDNSDYYILKYLYK
ncbi:hypothetical protein DW830_12815 [Prevotella sp. AM34-19LB]|jgi:hypothetical protein|uniref:6-bladed beta-propeller n=1 Tax=Prevotella sp. AM34-19LB TaxID=2292364 RepID=UPI000E5CACF5|nr:6-bladed beta-propeller [Prevotella sp. AM34-19LB]RHC73496.1 hypothetical protein DW830_12815 [Prevotella sp. AM34-19LB]